MRKSIGKKITGEHSLVKRQQGQRSGKRPRRVQFEHQGKSATYSSADPSTRSEWKYGTAVYRYHRGPPRDEDAHVNPGCNFDDQENQENQSLAEVTVFRMGALRRRINSTRQPNRANKPEPLTDVLQQDQGSLFPRIALMGPGAITLTKWAISNRIMP